MPTTKCEKREELLRVVRDASGRAADYCGKTRPWDARLLITSIVCGAAATVLAGGFAISGDLKPIGRWRILCSIVSIFTASGTAACALHKTLQITARVSSAEKCVARLRALDVTISAGDVSVDDALQTFQHISEEHSACLA